MNNKLVIAIDKLTKEEAKKIVDLIIEKNEDKLNDIIFKVNDLLALVWFEWIKEIFDHPKAFIMLDSKYYDIWNTLCNYLEQIKKSWISDKVKIITVHASNWQKALSNLAKKKKELSLDHIKIIWVTLLTSLNSEDAFEIYNRNWKDTVLSLANIAYNSWIDWIVCSPLEVLKIREIFWEDFFVLTPWIRFDWDEKWDQIRISTPAWAIECWSNAIVMWRSILWANDISLAINRLFEEIKWVTYNHKDKLSFEKILLRWSRDELLKYIWVVYKRVDWWKYCRLTSGLINTMYINIWVLERYPSVLNRMCLENRNRLFEAWIFNESKIDDYVVLWAQMWSVRISAILAQALWINGTSIYTEKTWESSYWMALKRHMIDLKWKKVIIGEDIVMMWSTISSMIPLIRELGWEVVAVTCAWNRSWKSDFMWVPIISCFVPDDWKIYWDDKTPEEKRWDFPELPKDSVVCEKVKASWDELVLSMR